MKKSLKYIISFIFILVCYTNVYSQISIDVFPSNSKRYSIDIDYDDYDYYFLTLKVKDSILNFKEYDKEMKFLAEEYLAKDIKNDSINFELQNKIEIIENKYLKYSIQKITVLKKEEQEYNQIISQIINLTKEEFENKNRGFVTLGGFNIVIRQDKKIKVPLIRPTKERTPEIYNFIMATRNLFVERGVFPPS